MVPFWAPVARAAPRADEPACAVPAGNGNRPYGARRKGGTSMKLKLGFVALMLAAAVTVVVAPAGSAATATPDAAASPVAIPITGSLPGGGTFTGTFDLQRFT